MAPWPAFLSKMKANAGTRSGIATAYTTWFAGTNVFIDTLFGGWYRGWRARLGHMCCKAALFVCLNDVYMLAGESAGASPKRKEGCLDTQGEKLLQDLVNQEKSLVAQVEQARSQAKETIATAQQEANEVRANAVKQAEEAARAILNEAEQEAEKIRAEVVADADRVVQQLADQSKSQMERVVNAVLEKVLP